jgi:hypothetical protein
VLIGLALVQDVESRAKQREKSGEDEIDLDEMVATTSRALAPVLLPLVEFVAALSAGVEA